MLNVNLEQDRLKKEFLRNTWETIQILKDVFSKH